MKKSLFLLFGILLLFSFNTEELKAQSEDSTPKNDVGVHDDSEMSNDEGSGKHGKKNKKNKNLDALVEGKTQEDLEESNKVPLTKEEKAYLKLKEDKKKAQKKKDDLTRKRTDKVISKRQKKAKKKVTSSKKTYIKTH
jgi:uncharacterized protein YifE (UPF0438 family)